MWSESWLFRPLCGVFFRVDMAVLEPEVAIMEWFSDARRQGGLWSAAFGSATYIVFLIL